MSFSEVTQLPEWVQKYNNKLQSQYMHVHNSVYKKVLKETEDKGQADSRAFKAASSVLGKRVEKSEFVTYNRDAVLKVMIDKFVGNIKNI